MKNLLQKYLRLVSLALALACLLPAILVQAHTQYIMGDSNTRYLSKEELLEWDYESLGYIFNEIFARHGYVFRSGGIYDTYFRTRPWYSPNANPNNSEACYPKLNEIEWYNEKLIKTLREEIRNTGKYWMLGNKNFKDYVEWGFPLLSGFVFVGLTPNQRFDIYTGPSTDYMRGANGKAKVSTNGAVYLAGIENGWVLAMYETNKGGVRVGMFPQNQMKDSVSLPELDFYSEKLALISPANLTDDPKGQNEIYAKLKNGEEVTYLSTFLLEGKSFHYVEYKGKSQPVRGFIPESALPYLPMMEESANASKG